MTKAESLEEAARLLDRMFYYTPSRYGLGLDLANRDTKLLALALWTAYEQGRKDTIVWLGTLVPKTTDMPPK